MSYLIVFVVAHLVSAIIITGLLWLVLRKVTDGPSLVLACMGGTIAVSLALRIVSVSYGGMPEGMFMLFAQDIVAAVLVGLVWIVLQKRANKEDVGETFE